MKLHRTRILAWDNQDRGKRELKQDCRLSGTLRHRQASGRRLKGRKDLGLRHNRSRRLMLQRRLGMPKEGEEGLR